MTDQSFKVFKPPHRPKRPSRAARIFLAGSIDMGAAVDWQAAVIAALSEYPVHIFNPRRDDWDSSWKQDISNEPFRNQVEWELDHLDAADLILFYFDPNGKSPITLMELGYYAGKQDSTLLVCCPDGFWRKGNVQVFCARLGLPLLQSLEQLIDGTKMILGSWGSIHAHLHGQDLD